MWNLLQIHGGWGKLKREREQCSHRQAGPMQQATIKMLVWLLKGLKAETGVRHREGEEPVQLAQPGAQMPLLNFCHSFLVFRWR